MLLWTLWLHFLFCNYCGLNIEFAKGCIIEFLLGVIIVFVLLVSLFSLESLDC